MPTAKYVPNVASQISFLAQVRAIMIMRMHRACNLVERTAKQNISGSGSGILYGSHRASVPGAFPALDTGELHDSVNSKVIVGNNIDGFVGTDKMHGKYLEYGTRKMLPRPWLRRTVNMLKTRVSNILKGRE